MAKFRFEHRITLVYLLAGVVWIIFSDRLINTFISDKELLTDVQTFKGWFYVLVTGVLFFLFLKKHLAKLRKTEAELEKHRDNLQVMVDEKTRGLDKAVKDLSEKNKVIKQKNEDLQNTLRDLRETQAQLVHSDKMASLGILTAGVAHEINNPLNYISGGLSGLRSVMKKKDVDNEHTVLFMDSISKGVERISTIVSGLNNFSRDTDKYDELCDVHQILENCLVIINTSLSEKIKVEKKYDDGPIVVIGNSGKLHQVFLNLLVNAIDAIDNEGIVTITTHLENQDAFIEIKDTGCGIEPENIPKITDPFFTTKDPGEGTGLGLSITYNIIKNHNGSLAFDSELNRGTVVTVILPQKKVENG